MSLTPRMSNKRQIIQTLAIIAWVLSTVLFIKTVWTHPYFADSYTHLSVGKYISLFQTIPSHYDLSYKTADMNLAWISHSWLSDTILFGLVSMNLAEYGPAILLALWGIATGLLWLQLREFQVDWSSRFFIFSVIQFVAQIYWRVHPLILILPLFQISVLIHLRALSIKKTRYFTVLPFIAVLWANMYGGYTFIILGLQALFLIFAALKASYYRSRFLFLQSVAFLASVMIVLLNPYGYKVYTSAATFIGIVSLKRAFVSLPNLLNLVNQSFLLENISTIPYATFAVIMLLVIAGCIVIIVRDRSRFLAQYGSLLPLLALFALSYAFVRFIPLTLYGVGVLAGVLLQYLISNYRRAPLWLGIFCACIIPYLIYCIIFPFKILSIALPSEQVALVGRYHLPNNILTTSELTGYAKYMLPAKLNIDLLDEVFDETETLNVMLQSGVFPKQTLTTTLDSKHIGTIIASKESGNFARSVQLQLAKDWALIYIDTNGVVFVRRNKVAPSFLKTHELRYLTLANNLGVNPKFIPEGTVELEYALKMYPKNTLYRGQLASLYRIQKHPEKAVALLYEIPQDQWDYRLFTEMGRLQASMGNCIASEQFLLRALDGRTETNFSQAVLDLAIVYAGCFQDKDKAQHYFERYLTFTIPHTEKEKARKIASDFGITVE